MEEINILTLVRYFHVNKLKYYKLFDYEKTSLLVIFAFSIYTIQIQSHKKC